MSDSDKKEESKPTPPPERTREPILMPKTSTFTKHIPKSEDENKPED